jgi:hypothetical protein
MDKLIFVIALAAIWKTAGISSPAIKNIFGILRRSP